MAARRSIRFRPAGVCHAAIVTLTLAACGTAQTTLPVSSRLDAPQHVVAQSDGLGIMVSWDPVDGASSYRVYWKQGSTVTPQSGSQATASAPPYFQQAAAFDLTYAFAVAAVDDGGRTGRVSHVVTTTPSGAVFDAPQHVSAAAGDRLVIITWDPSPGATGYRIEVTTPFGQFSVPDPVAPPFTHSPLLNRTEYGYRVRAKFGTQLGPWSAKVSAIPMPAVPGSPIFTDVRGIIRTDFDAAGTPTGTIQLSWSATEHATNYQVYVRTDPDPTAPEEPLIDPNHPLKSTTYQDYSSVEFGASYWYRVEAINDGVTSPPLDLNDVLANSVRASVPPPLEPGVAYGYRIRGVNGSGETEDVPVVSVEPLDDGRARDLSWTPPAAGAATSQRLYRAAPPGDTPELIATFQDLATSGYRDKGIAPYPVPTGLTITPQGAAHLVTWSPVLDASRGYRLYWWEQAVNGAVSTGSEDVVDTQSRRAGLHSGSIYRYAVQVVGYPGVSPASSVTAP